MTALPPVFVLGCHYNGLGIIRELGARGVKVIGLDCRRSVGSYSRYAHFFLCPDPASAEEELVEKLVDLAASQPLPPVIIPTNDTWACAVSRHIDRLSGPARVCAASWDLMKILIQKELFSPWAAAQGLPVPRTWETTAQDQIPDDAFPLAAKPSARQFSSSDPAAPALQAEFNRLRLTVLNNRTELQCFTQKNAGLLRYFILQEYIPGLSDRMITVGVYADRQGQVRGLFSGRKLRGFSPDFGDCMFGQAESVPEMLVEQAVKTCLANGYHGIAEFEYKQHAGNGRYYLIEINPRSWSWIGITPACGVSLPWLAYADLAGLDIPQFTRAAVPNGSVKWVRLIPDLMNCLIYNREAGFQEWGMTPRAWLRSLQSQNLVTAEFARQDPLPGLAAAAANLARLIGLAKGPQ